MGIPLENTNEDNLIVKVKESFRIIHKKIDYIFYRFIFPSLLGGFLNQLKTKEKGENMEDTKIVKFADLPKEYDHSVLFKSFEEIQFPLLDTEGNIRSTEEQQINKGIISRNPVQVIRSSDLIKIQNDYKTIQNSHIKLENEYEKILWENKSTTQKLDSLMDFLKIQEENNKKEFAKLNAKIDELTIENNELKKQLDELTIENNGLKNRLISVETKNSKLLEENQVIQNDNNQLKNNHYSDSPISQNRHKKTENLKIEVQESDRDQEIYLKNKKIKPYEFRPGRGFLDTWAYEWPCRSHKRDVEELREAAADGNYMELLTILKSMTVDINGRGMSDSVCSLLAGYKDRTALILAAKEGHFRCAKLLIEYGAEVDCLDRDNKTALDYARENKHERIVQLLNNNNAHSGNFVKNALNNQEQNSIKLKSF